MSSFLLLFGAGLVCGTINSLTLKFLYQTPVLYKDIDDHNVVIDADDQIRYFQKPWFMNGVMFVSMLLALPMFYLRRWWLIRKTKRMGIDRESDELASSSRPSPGVLSRTGASTSGGESESYRSTGGTSSIVMRIEEIDANGQQNLNTEQLSKGNEQFNGSSTISPASESLKEPLLASQADEQITPLASESSDDGSSLSWNMIFSVFIPSICDLLGTGLGQMGLCVVSVSTMQMLKGSVLLFSAMLSVKFLGKRLNRANYVGIGLCMLALLLVSLASVWGAGEDDGSVEVPASDPDSPQAPTNPTSSSTSKEIFGILIIIIGQLICAIQYVVEEFLLRPPNVAPPLALVGLEGFWGTVLMVVFVIPLCYWFKGKDPRPGWMKKSNSSDIINSGGVYENTEDSFSIEYNNSTVFILTLVFFISVLAYNIIGVTVTAEASAIHHTFLDASRTLLIWILSVFIYYSVNPEYGEPLTIYSPLQGVGFGLLIAGQLVYDEVIRLPSCLMGAGAEALDSSSLKDSKGSANTDSLDMLKLSARSFPSSSRDRWLKISPPGTRGKIEILKDSYTIVSSRG